jgi:hypothetical protein
MNTKHDGKNVSSWDHCVSLLLDEEIQAWDFKRLRGDHFLEGPPLHSRGLLMLTP